MYDYQNNYNTLQDARHDLIGEIEAIIQYDSHIANATSPSAKATWQDIKEEETVHVGELLALLYSLDSTMQPLVEKGMMEFNNRGRE